MKLFLCLNHFKKSSMWNSGRDPEKLLRFDYTSTWTKLLTSIKKSCVNKGKFHGDSKKCSIVSWTIWSVKNQDIMGSEKPSEVRSWGGASLCWWFKSQPWKEITSSPAKMLNLTGIQEHVNHNQMPTLSIKLTKL